MTAPDKTAPQEGLVIRRIIDAPVELVWQAWTDPAHVMRWWGPKNYTSPSAKIDLRVGGKFIFGMRAPAEQGGQDSYTSGVYTKIVPYERLEFTQGMSDKDGTRVNPQTLGLPPDFPQEMNTVIQFIRKGEMTELIITESHWTASPIAVFAYAGMHESLDKMSEVLANAG